MGFTIALVERTQEASTGVATVVALVAAAGGLVAYMILAPRLGGVDDDRLLVGSTLVMTLGVAGITFTTVTAVVALAALVVAVGRSLGWLALQHRTLTLRPGQLGTTMAVVSAIEITGFLLSVAVGAVADRFGLVAALGVLPRPGLVMTVLAAGLSRWR